MKTNLFFIVLILALILPSCNKDNDPKEPDPVLPTTLEAPKNIVFDSQKASFSWDKVKDATGYQCALDLLSITIADVIKNPAAVLNNPVRDQWQMFHVRAVNGNVVSDISSLEFIITDKTILDTPTEFKYEIFDKAGTKFSLKLTWGAVTNATKYETSCAISLGASTVTTGKTVKTNELIIPSVTEGSTITLRVRALPGDTDKYVNSKQGVAQAKDLK